MLEKIQKKFGTPETIVELIEGFYAKKKKMHTNLVKQNMTDP